MYKLNIAYTKKELAKDVFEISEGTFKNSSKMYMNHLREYFEVREVQAGRHPKYILVKELKPWETYGQKIARENHKIVEDYRDAADVVISKAPRQTFTNIANKIDLYNINNINHKYEHTKETKRKNVGKAVKEYYTPANGRWCEKLKDGNFRPLNQDELDLYYGLQEEYKSQYFDKSKTEKAFKVMNQKRKGEIDSKELDEKMEEIFGSWYDTVMGEFKKVYGFTPIWVKEWERKEDKWNNIK